MQLLTDLDKVVEKEIKAVIDKGCIGSSEWENLRNAVTIMEKSKEIQSMLMNDYEYQNERGMQKSYGDGPMVFKSPTHIRGVHRYSSHSIRDRIVDNLERMYDDAATDHERTVLDEMISYVRHS